MLPVFRHDRSHVGETHPGAPCQLWISLTGASFAIAILHVVSARSGTDPIHIFCATKIHQAPQIWCQRTACSNSHTHHVLFSHTS